MISCDRFESINHRRDRDSWNILYHQMNMVFIRVYLYDLKIRFFLKIKNNCFEKSVKFSIYPLLDIFIETVYYIINYIERSQNAKSDEVPHLPQ